LIHAFGVLLCLALAVGAATCDDDDDEASDAEILFNCDYLCYKVDECGGLPCVPAQDCTEWCLADVADSTWECVLLDDCDNFRNCLCGAEYGGDDDDFDDDTGGYLSCDDVWRHMYDDCGWAFIDGYGNEIPLQSVIAACEVDDATYGPDGALYACVVDYWDDCDAMLYCLAEVIEG
jgi:hypothetical protein